MRKTIVKMLLVALILAGPSVVIGQDNGTEPPEGLRPYRPEVYVLSGATIVTSPGRKIENGVIVVRGEKIVAVGDQTQVTPPADARLVDVTGKTIYAGFVDGFGEQSIDIAPSTAGSPYWNSNITPQRSVAAQYAADAEANGRLRSQGVVARLVAPDDGIIKGQSAILLTSDDSNDRAVVADDAALHIRLTVSRRGGGPAYPNSPMGAVALARQALYDAQWYRDAWGAASADSRLTRPERNDALAALQPYLSGDQLVILDSFNELYALRADRFAREFSLKAVVLGSGNEYRRLDAIRDMNRTLIVPVDFPQPPDVSTDEVASSVSLESLMHWDLAPENPGRLVQAGVRIVLTSYGLDDTKQFLKNVRRAVQRGLAADEALAALTTVPASLYGVDDLLGTIEPGKLACFIVCSDDVFADEAKVEETWVRGQRYELEDEEDRDVTGEWSMDLEYTTGKPNHFVVEVRERSGRLSGSIKSSSDEDAKSAQFDTINIVGPKVSGSFPAYAFDQQGVARFSAVVELDGETWMGLGHLTWPDGTRSTLKISPGEASAKKPSKDAVASDEKSDAQESDDADKSNDETDKSREVAASFDVNYPLGAFGVTEQPAVAPQLVIRNATIWTSGPQGIIENGDMLIGGGKILAIGQDLDVDDEVKEFDAEGMHVSPGLIDCHSHMASDGGINESGQAITAEVRIGDFIDCDDITIYRQLAGGLTTSNILHGSANPIGGQNQVIKLRWGQLDESMKFAEAPAGIKFALGENVKRSSSRYPNSRMGVEQLFRDEFNAAQRYLDQWQAWHNNPNGMPPRRDLELDAMAEILSGNRWIHCHSYRQDEILALIRILDEYGITIGTFQHILEGYKVAEAMAEHGAMASAFSDWWNYKVEVEDAIPYAGALMHEAGIVVSFNSDDGELARHMNHEAAKAVKYGGVSPAEALKFVTLNPAKQLRIDQYVGSLEVGKHADFVIWNASPLSNFARCEQTWIDGRKYFDRDVDLKMRDDLAHKRNTLIQKILSSGQKMRPRGTGDGDPSGLWPREDLFCGAHGHTNDAWYFSDFTDAQLHQQMHQQLQQETQTESKQ